MINSIPHFPRYNISFFGNKTYVIGHKTPDSDSVCSAIGQAYLENKLKSDPEKEYQAISAGDINAETAYALAAFGVKPPKVKKDVSLRIEEAMDKQDLSDISIDSKIFTSAFYPKLFIIGWEVDTSTFILITIKLFLDIY